MEQELFSVTQFFPGGTNETVRSNVTDQEAADAYKHYTSSVGAMLGFTNRVIITDSGDRIVAEWLFSAGHVFPIPPYATPMETSAASH